MSSEQEFKCVFCSETFSQKDDFQIHFRKHGDPNFNQKLKERPQDEAVLSADKPKDQGEIVECEVCTEVFSTISKAITHKHKMHPDHDTKYFCPWCGKLFTMKHLHNKHIQASHSDMERSEENFHCNMCEVDFYRAAAMLYHNKFYHRQDELPTLGHSKKLKMIQEDVVQIYYCPFCGEEYDNKVNLHMEFPIKQAKTKYKFKKHMTDDHCGENQSPDDVFRCPLCDAIFFYLDAYELHLTFHSIEDLYTERNEMIDEITDFSLETVQPMQEKVEPVNEEEPAGIEQLLEFTMNDESDTRKSKKHKKHKKSKKAAITLDEFLNMNKDVFGEGIDFQGVEEVPTQVVAKRLKSKQPVSASKFVASDLAKLKKQGIVVKKQSTNIGRPNMLNKGVMPRSGINTQKNVNSKPQTKTNALTSTDAVLSKLLNQGSQIKIVKKSNQDSEEHIEEKQDSTEQEKLTQENNATENEHKSLESEVNEKDDKTSTSQNVDILVSKINNDKIERLASSTNPESPSIIGDNKDVNIIQNCMEVSNYSKKFDSEIKSDEVSSHAKNVADLIDNTNKIQNDSNAVTTKSRNPDNKEIEIEPQGKVDTTQKPENNTEASMPEKSSINALKHLSHSITIKPVNSTKQINENNLSKPEMPKMMNISQSNHAKIPESPQLTNLKNLGITIKSTSQTRLDTSKINQAEENRNNNDEEHETDNELNDDMTVGNKTVNKINAGITQTKSPHLNIQTKPSPKTIQKESPKASHNDNSQSSADLLKHLKNVTAKPVNLNSQKVSTPQLSPSSTKKSIQTKTLVQSEVTEDGIEIFSIDDSDSDEANYNKSTNNTAVKSENKIEPKKSTDKHKIINKKLTPSSTNQLSKTVNKDADRHSSKTMQDEDAWSDECDETETKINANSSNHKFNSPKPNQKNAAINNVLKNLSKNITVKSRTSSPSQPVQSQDHNSKDSESNDDSDSDLPLSRVKITEMENMSDDEILQEKSETNIPPGNAKVEYPDDSQSENDDEPIDEEFDDMSDIESHIEAAKVQKGDSPPNSSLNTPNNIKKDSSIKSSNKTQVNCKPESSSQSDEMSSIVKNLSNQISIKQLKKPDSKNSNIIEQTAAHSMNSSSFNQKQTNSSNQVNTFNKETKTVKTFQTQTKTVIQEITTTVTKTIKTVNQTMKQEVRNMAQSSSLPSIGPQKVMNANFSSQRNFQGVKVRQSVPNMRPKIRGQAPQTTRPAICAPPPGPRSATCAPIRGSNQLVPVRPALNRPSGPRSRMPNVVNFRASTSGQQRPQMMRSIKVSPGAVLTPKKPAESPGHFSCFKKPKESLIPVPDFTPANNSDSESSVQFSSATQMSKSNFSSTTKTMKGNSVVTSTQMKSEMSASSKQLSKLRGVSGLSVVKTSQSQTNQAQVEEKSEISASKRNALEAIQRLQNQGLLIKKPRLDVSEDSDHSNHESDEIDHDSNGELDE